jgi:hypothetical protein
MIHSTRNTPFLQSLLFSHEDFSPCLFRRPSERESEFLSFFQGVQSLLTCEELHSIDRLTVCSSAKGITTNYTWEQIFYFEFDGKRKKHALIKIIGE